MNNFGFWLIWFGYILLFKMRNKLWPAQTSHLSTLRVNPYLYFISPTCQASSLYWHPNLTTFLQSDRCQNNIKLKLMHSFLTSKTQNMESISSSSQVNTPIYFSYMFTCNLSFAFSNVFPPLSTTITTHLQPTSWEALLYIKQEQQKTFNWINKNSKERKARQNVRT